MATLKPYDPLNHEPGTMSRLFPDQCSYGFHCHNKPVYSVYSERGWVNVSSCEDERHVDEAKRWADALERSLARRFPKYAKERGIDD